MRKIYLHKRFDSLTKRLFCTPTFIKTYTHKISFDKFKQIYEMEIINESK